MAPRSTSFSITGGRGLLIQLFLIVFLPLTIILLAVNFASLSAHQKAMRALVDSRDERAVRAAAASLSIELEHRQNSLDGLLDILPSADSISPAEFLRSISLESLFDRGITLIDTNGVTFSSGPGSNGWELLMSNGFGVDWIERTPEEGDIFSLKDVTSWVVYLAASSPDGEWMAVGAFSIDSIVSSGLSMAVPPGNQVTVMIVNQDGDVLYQKGSLLTGTNIHDHPTVSRALAGESGATTIQSDREDYISAFSPIQETGWALVVEEPWHEVESPVLRNTLFAPLVLVPSLLISLAALVYGARQIFQPLQRLEDQAARLSWGDFSAVDDPVNGISEIRRLQKELGHLARKVQAAQQGLHNYIGAITTGQEEERSRLARELHDETLQSLIALKQRVQLVQLSNLDCNDAIQFGELEDLAEQSITGLRRITRALRPIYLEDLGLAPALEMLVGEVRKVNLLQVEFHLTGVERRLSPQIELALYRIAQEALTNLVSHSQASHAVVELHFSPDQVTLLVEDNGMGFEVPKSPAEFTPEGHYGLMGMHERAELIGAKLQVISSPGKGTTVNVSVPE